MLAGDLDETDDGGCVSPVMHPRYIPSLLDKSVISGTHAIDRYFSPPRFARLVDGGSYSDAVTAVRQTCSRWGGTTDILIPIQQSGQLTADWEKFLSISQVDAVLTRDVVERFEPSVPLADIRDGERHLGELVISMLARRPEGVNRSLPCFDPSIVSEDDPWHLAYVGCLGLLPSSPSPQDLQLSSLVPGTTFADVYDIDTAVPENIGLDDLISRTQGVSSATNPTHLAALGWGVQQPSRGGNFSGEPLVPMSNIESRNFNENVIVVYTPQDASDLCLLWNLRAAYGHLGSVPAALPLTASISDDIKRLLRPGNFYNHGFRRLKVALVSVSVSEEKLREIAEATDERCRAAPMSSVLRVGYPLTRNSAEIAVFDKGYTRLPALTYQDKTEIADLTSTFGKGQFESRFVLRGRSLPIVPSLNVGELFADRASHGGVYARRTTDRQFLDVVWPSGWTVLTEAVRGLGMTATQSIPGHLAAEFLHQIGGWDEMLPVLDTKIIELLYEKSQKSGMSWFRNRATQIARAVFTEDEGGRGAELERRISDLSIVAQADEELNEITFHQVKAAMAGSARAAKEWIRWAEDRRLVHRGISMLCPECRKSAWMPLAQVAPPVICRRCGASVQRPYPPDRIEFRYRLSEQMISLVEHDSLPHLYAARFLLEILDSTREANTAYGAYPGVLIRKDGEEADADVLLLLADGSLIPGECKRTSAGLKDSDLRKLEKLTSWLGSPWSFVATLDSAEDCTEIWRSAEQSEGAPRYVLTKEQLLSTRPVWMLNGKPLTFGGDEMITGGPTVAAILGERPEQDLGHPTFRTRD
ncbi:hypothetical protein [Micromonospora saelicesensis]|uniref:hypothetical protein n=1 Tax=Micromonospora saelicesensis TaxID=285676 RepID=UPI00114C9BDA|nr:hypothetical protein [Micromonospora saelicesensis]